MGDLADWTGVSYEGSETERKLAWAQWWKLNHERFPPGPRYFSGRDVDLVFG
jgi:hypothetical protein